MKISNKVAEPLGKLISGDTGSAPYLSGPKLVGFYNECGASWYGVSKIARIMALVLSRN